MDGPLLHFFIILPVFAGVLMFVVMPILQWASTRLLDRRFVLRFGGPWSPKNKEHRWDVLFSILAFLLSLTISFLILQLLILEGILPPLG